MKKKNILFFILLVLVVLFLSFLFFYFNSVKLINKEILFSNNSGLLNKDKDKEKQQFPLSLEFGHKGRLWVNDIFGYSGVYDGEGIEIMTKKSNANEELNFLNVFVEEGLTDMVFTESHAFLKDAFVFVTTSGKIYGWHKNLETGIEDLTAILRVDNSKNNSIYTGVSAYRTEDGYRLYVADFKNRKIEIYNENYKNLTYDNKYKNAFLQDTFGNFSPFGIKALNNLIYISLINENDGKAKINVYNEKGEFVKTLKIDNLIKPWGMALAKSDFGKYKNMLFIGDFATGKIAIYDLEKDIYIGNLKNNLGIEVVIDKLSSLTFGTDNGAGKSNELFYSRVPDSKDKLIFGKLLYE